VTLLLPYGEKMFFSGGEFRPSETEEPANSRRLEFIFPLEGGKKKIFARRLAKLPMEALPKGDYQYSELFYHFGDPACGSSKKIKIFNYVS
jgi:hypothetical protein